MEQTKKYNKSFVNFDKVSTSKDKKKVIIHVGNMLLSLNINYLKAIIHNAETESQQTQSTGEAS